MRALFGLLCLFYTAPADRTDTAFEEAQSARVAEYRTLIRENAMSIPVRKTARLPSGLVLPYLDQSDRGSPALLFLHGLTDSCRSFETLMAHLPATLRAVAPSMRGHAGASIPES